MAGGGRGGESCMAGETATAADGKHPTGMHSCYGLFTLPYSDTDADPKSDCEPNGYIVLCGTFHTARSQIPIEGWDWNRDHNRDPGL